MVETKPYVAEPQYAEACPYCAAGNAPRQRIDTGEYVHDYFASERDLELPNGMRLMRGGFVHTICGANALRQANGS